MYDDNDDDDDENQKMPCHRRRICQNQAYLEVL